MISSRQSVAAEPNPGLKPESREQAESNAGWLERVLGDKKPEGWDLSFRRRQSDGFQVAGGSVACTK